MSENLIPKVAEMLGLKLYEDFFIDRGEEDLERLIPFSQRSRYHFTEENLFELGEGGHQFKRNHLIPILLKGAYTIIKPVPKVLKDGETYYFVIDGGRIRARKFNCGSYFDVFNAEIGNCFSSQVEAEYFKDDVLKIYKKRVDIIKQGKQHFFRICTN